MNKLIAHINNLHEKCNAYNTILAKNKPIALEELNKYSDLGLSNNIVKFPLGHPQQSSVADLIELLEKVISETHEAGRSGGRSELQFYIDADDGIIVWYRVLESISFDAVLTQFFNSDMYKQLV
jgi:hypothetical protein